MAKLKMVAGQTYMAPALFGSEKAVVRNEVVEVADERASLLLDDFYTDSLGNKHYYFAEVGSDAAPEEVTKEATQPSRRRKSA